MVHLLFLFLPIAAMAGTNDIIPRKTGNVTSGVIHIRARVTKHTSLRLLNSSELKPNESLVMHENGVSLAASHSEMNNVSEATVGIWDSSDLPGQRRFTLSPF